MINHFNIVRSTGLIFLGVGVFFLSISFSEFLYEGLHTAFRNQKDLYALLLIGAGFFISGMAGLIKTKWFPISGRITMVLSFFVFHWFFFETILPDSSRRSELYLSIALLITVYVLILTFFLLLGNENFLEALEKKEEGGFDDDGILDAE